jgi:dihydropteroate synthase
MIKDGADILDIGGYSTRPGASDIDVDTELGRVMPAIESIKSAFPNTILSIDTWRGQVAKQAIEAGCRMVNDVSAWQLDHSMFDVLCAFRPAYIVMHMRGTPQSMNGLTSYDDVTGEVIRFLSEKIGLLHLHGVYDIAIDPGFGFAKTIEQNFTLLRELKRLDVLGKPILTGLSRKSFIYKTLEAIPEEALNGSTAMHMVALMNGAKILRVHDVRAARECICLYQHLKG